VAQKLTIHCGAAGEELDASAVGLIIGLANSEKQLEAKVRRITGDCSFSIDSSGASTRRKKLTNPSPALPKLDNGWKTVDKTSGLRTVEKTSGLSLLMLTDSPAVSLAVDEALTNPLSETADTRVEESASTLQEVNEEESASTLQEVTKESATTRWDEGSTSTSGDDREVSTPVPASRPASPSTSDATAPRCDTSPAASTPVAAFTSPAASTLVAAFTPAAAPPEVTQEEEQMHEEGSDVSFETANEGMGISCSDSEASDMHYEEDIDIAFHNRGYQTMGESITAAPWKLNKRLATTTLGGVPKVQKASTRPESTTEIRRSNRLQDSTQPFAKPVPVVHQPPMWPVWRSESPWPVWKSEDSKRKTFIRQAC